MASGGPDRAPPRRKSTAFCPLHASTAVLRKGPVRPCQSQGHSSPVGKDPGAQRGGHHPRPCSDPVSGLRPVCPGPQRAGSLRWPQLGRTHSDSCELLAHQAPHTRRAWAHQPLRIWGPQGPSASCLHPIRHPPLAWRSTAVLAPWATASPPEIPRSAGASHSRSQQEPQEERGQHLPQTTSSSRAGLEGPPINNGIKKLSWKGGSPSLVLFPFLP